MKALVILVLMSLVGLGSPSQQHDVTNDVTPKMMTSFQRLKSLPEASNDDGIGLEAFERMVVTGQDEYADRLGSACQNVSQSCQADCNEYVNHLKDIKDKKLPPFWALKMFDATGKLPDGILAGNFNAMGSYSSCLEIEVIEFWTKKLRFNGKFALVSIPLYGGALHANFGICLPSSCQREDFNTVVRGNVPGASKLRPEWVLVNPPQTKDTTFVWDTLSYAFIIFVGVVVTLSFVATLADFWYQAVEKQPKDLKMWEKFLMAFSLYTNTGKLFAITQPSKDHLNCLDGIRFLSISWVMLGHWFGNMGTVFKVNNFFPTAELTYQNFWFQAIDNAFVSVDTFFVLSACLVSYLTLKELDRNKGSINLPLFYIHRYLRLTGAYAFCIFFQATLVGAFNYGPAANPEFQTGGCRKYFYRNLGYFSIYDYKEDGSNFLNCLGQTWYLDNDMQMFIFAIFLIYPLWRVAKFGLPVAGALAVGSAIIPTVLTATNDWPATPVMGGPNAAAYFMDNYIKPWCRVSPYLVGIVLGYLLHATKNKPVKIPRVLNVILWVVAFGAGFGIVYGLNIPIRLTATNPEPLSKAANVVYGGFHRLSWAICISWVIFACCRGYGGWVNEFLSWEAFQPLSRVSFIMYLTHLTVYSVVAASMTFEVTYTHLTAVIYFLASLVITLVVSAIIFVGIEMPWLTVEKLSVSWLMQVFRGKPKKNAAAAASSMDEGAAGATAAAAATSNCATDDAISAPNQNQEQHIDSRAEEEGCHLANGAKS